MGLLQCGEWWRQLPLRPSEDETGEMGERKFMGCPIKVYIRKMTAGPLSGIYGNFVQECLVQGREGTHLAVAMGTDLRGRGSAKSSHNYCPFPCHPWLDRCVYWGRHGAEFTHETVPPNNIWLWESGLEGQQDLIIRLPQAWGNSHSSLGRHKQNLVCTKTQRKRAVIPQETEPKLPAVVGESPVEPWVVGAPPLYHY